MIWWTKSWNPVIGCTKCSPACDNCYAEALHTQRHKAKLAGAPMPLCYAEPFEKIDLNINQLEAPLHWRKPQRIFVCNMGDLFHEDVSWSRQYLAFLGVMAVTPQHTYMILTKRPERMRDFIASQDLPQWPWPNVWLGTTVWDQASADRAVPILLSTPAAKRFVSVEPMLGPVDLGQWFERIDHCGACGAESPAQVEDVCPECGSDAGLITTWGCAQAERYRTGERYSESPAGEEDLKGQPLDWIICGGETGAKARPMHPDWPRSLRNQCLAAGVPFMFKQWGEWAPWDFERTEGGAYNKTGGRDHYKVDSYGRGEPKRIGKRAAGRVLDGRTWEEVPHGL